MKQKHVFRIGMACLAFAVMFSISLSAPAQALNTNYPNLVQGSVYDLPGPDETITNTVYASPKVTSKYLIMFKNQTDKELEALRIKKYADNRTFKKTSSFDEFKHLSTVALELTEDEYRTYQSRQDVEFIEPDHKVTLLDTQRKNSLSPEDEKTSWGYNLLGAGSLAEQGVLGKNIRIGVIDTGIDGSHEDLHVEGGTSFYGSFNQDENGHGTQMAGIIAAQLNGIGTKGVSPTAQLFSIKALDRSGIGNYSDIIAGIDWAIENKMNILNMSFGGQSPSPALLEALRKARQAGILIIAPSGNNGTQQLLYPAAYAAVMSVGSVDSSLKRSSFSNFSDQLELSAPGESIITTSANDQYLTVSGTSAAAAHATAAAALVWSVHPNWHADDVRKALINAADAAAGTQNIGYGVIHPTNAIHEQYMRNINLRVDEDNSLTGLPGGNVHIQSTHLSSDKTVTTVKSSVRVSYRYDDQPHPTRVVAADSNGKTVDSKFFDSAMTGVWEFIPYEPGIFRIQAVPVDAPDYPSNTITITVNPAAPIDTTPPVVEFSLETNDKIQIGNSYTVNFTATDNVGIAKFRVLLDNEDFAIIQGPGTWTPRTRGIHKFTVIAEDTSGNVTEKNFDYTVFSRGRVVLIPGVTGSELYNKDESLKQLWPIPSNIFSVIGDLSMNSDGSSKKNVVHGPPVFFVYNPMKVTLENEGFDVTDFGYDWRVDVADTARRLQALVETLPEEKVTIVAHSMGGLVAKKFAQSNTSRINKIVYIGVPFLGSASSFQVSQNGLFDIPLFAQLSRNMTSAYELLPPELHFQLTNSPYFETKLTRWYGRRDIKKLTTYQQTVDILTGRGPNGAAIDWFNEPLYRKAEQLHASIRVNPEVDSYYIVGTKSETPGLIQLGYSETGMFSDKYSYNGISDISMLDGDGTVTVTSATMNFLTPEAKTYYIERAEHKALPSKDAVMQLTANILKNVSDLPNGILKKPNPNDKSLKLLIECPVDLHVYDAAGNHDGRVNNLEQYESNIPGSSYNVMGDKKLVALKDGTYSVKLVGTDVGKMTFSYFAYDEKRNKQKTIKFEEVAVTPSTVMNTQVSINGNLALQIDENGDGIIERTLQPSVVLDADGSNDNINPKIYYQLTGSMGVKDWYSSDVIVNLTGFDSGAGLRDIMYNVNGGEFRKYAAPFKISQDGDYHFTAFSLDKNNNHSDIIEFDVHIDKKPPLPPIATMDHSDWTNKDVTVTLNLGDEQDHNVKLEYQLNGAGEWHTYSGPFQITTDGVTSILARATDWAGNGSAKVTSKVYIDRKQPTTPILQTTSTDWTEDNVQVTVAAGKDLESGVRGAQYKVGAAGIWNDYTVPFVITAEGETFIYGRTVDNAGNVSAETIVPVRIDRTSPSPPVLSPNINEWTNKDTLVKLQHGWDAASGVSKSQYKLRENDAWTDYSTPITITTEGETKIYARSIDKLGHIGASSDITIRIDKTAPSTPLLAISNSKWTTSNVPFSVVSGKDFLSGVYRTEYKLNSGNWTEYVSPVTVDTEGITTVYVRTIDRAGNVSSEVSGTIQIDRTEPSPTIVLNNVEWQNTKATFYLSTGNETGSGVSKQQYKIGTNGPWIDYSFMVPFNTEGMTPVFARAIDNLSNISPESMAYIKIDKTPPSMPSNLISTGKTTNTISLSWGASSDNISYVKGYEIYQGSTLLAYTAETNYTVTGLVSKKSYTFTIKARDAAGNVAPSNPLTVTTN
ncbi:alpha/beta fold hydrolase [Paenibacillus chitinolyticus]